MPWRRTRSPSANTASSKVWTISGELRVGQVGEQPEARDRVDQFLAIGHGLPLRTGCGEMSTASCHAGSRVARPTRC